MQAPNILKDRVFRAKLADGQVQTVSLCEVLALMSDDEIESFPSLRPHQRHAWHAFLAQLATLALHESRSTDIPRCPEAWRGLLRNLTQKFPQDEPWRLVVDDTRLPAFMQPPAGPDRRDYRGQCCSPDDLDILVTSKNHDVKQSIAREPLAEDWIFALISLQTMAGFLGQGNYGIARMNGGFSSRPSMGLYPAKGRCGACLFYDVRRMIDGREKLLQEYPYYRRSNGVRLLWLQTWNGKESLSLNQLDPYFIEICRRVRFLPAGNSWTAMTAGSKTARIQASDAKGNIGDFWAPVSIAEKEPKALSVSGAGFTYKKLREVLLDHSKFKQPRSMEVDSTPESIWRVIARGIAAGQGKTEGYHERRNILFSGKTAPILFRKTSAHRDLSLVSESLMEEIGEVSKALRRGIAVAASGGRFDKSSDKGRELANKFGNKLDDFADGLFFEQLDERFQAAESERLNVRRQFVCRLIDEGESILNDAIATISCSSALRLRSKVVAQRAFHGLIRSPKSTFSDDPKIFTQG
ncbi:MAG: type I-E CRISPR-associated protein Cse1/CasA [Gammaproteobacteria bacterium]|nr:type I-E CRISPR-associated protein Cse1/CasA [Gammaproteobacteria bacterium]